MATPLNGNKLGVYIDVDDNATTSTTSERLVALATNASLSFSNATIEVSSKKTNDGGTLLDSGTSLTHAIAGASSWSISCEGLLDLSTPAQSDDHTTDASGTGEHGFVNLINLAVTRKKVYVYFKDASATTTTGTELCGTAFIESIEASGGVDDFSTYSVTFKGDGDLSVQAT